MLKNNILSILFIISILMTLLFYLVENNEVNKIINSYVEFNTSSNLKAKLSKGRYILYKAGVSEDSDDNFHYSIIQDSINKNIFKLYRFEEKKPIDFLPKSKSIIITSFNDRTYEAIGGFTIDTENEVLLDTSSINGEIKTLAYQNEVYMDLLMSSNYCFLMLFSIAMSIVFAILLLMKKIGKLYLK